MNLLYGWIVLVALTISLKCFGGKLEQDRKLLVVYLFALFGALVGAHLGYFLAESRLIQAPNSSWLSLLSGKTILGGLIGGFLSVELTKTVIRYKKTTGDLFALSVPIAIAVARIGCLDAQCCLGKVCPAAWYTIIDSHGLTRWPAVPTEIIFNLIAATVFLFLRRRALYPGQHFHLYMIGYGCFRFFHEYVRDTPLVTAELSGYQLLSLTLCLLGLTGFVARELEYKRMSRVAPA